MKRLGRMLLASAIAFAGPMTVTAANATAQATTQSDRMDRDRMDRDRMDRDRMGPDRMGERMGPAERQHAMDTLRVGALALETSRVAERNAGMAEVREFARFEVTEQNTVAQIVREMSGMAPPPPDARGRMTLSMLQRTRGPAFDRAYIQAQLDGHRELLSVQDRYLAAGRNQHQRHVAMLARGQIMEHIALLTDMQRPRRR